MLTQDEKIDLYFDEAFRNMNMTKVEESVKGCVFALLPKMEDQEKFWQRVPMDPRKNEVWRRNILKDVIKIMNFCLF